MKRVWVWMMAVGLFVGLAGCAGEAAPPSGTGEVPVVTRADAGRVLAEAVVEAAEQRTVSVRTGGTVLELRVADGDRVAAGDVLLRLDPIDAELAMAQAEASLAQAEAQLARLEAGPREVELAVAEAQVGTTRSVVSQALAQRDRLYSGTTEAQIAAAEADLAAAQAEELVRRITHDRTMECEDIPDSDRQHCPLLGAPEEQARFAWQAAVARRLAAEAALEALAQGATAEERVANTGVAVARAQESVAEVQLAQLEAGVAAEEVAAARAAVAQAATARDMAQVALTRMAVTAPIAGTVTWVAVEEGDQVAPGQVIVHIATLDALQVRTVDLTELDVVRLEVGQVVEVGIDALPELALVGHVSEIGYEAINYRGDVTYPVVVVLDEVDPRLRLGMTAEVRIEAP